jgi:hypothetical protein
MLFNNGNQPSRPSGLGSRLSGAFLLLLATAALSPLSAGTVTLDFEGFPDSTSLTTQYPGLTFTNATIISSGISLNEFEFPPHSGTNVAFDDGGPISISFASPVLSFGGYFTYAEPLTLAAFDSTSAQVATAVSLFSNNDALFGDSGSSPNEFLQVLFASGISSVTITGASLGGSFVMDDATLTTADTTAVPEPGSIFLLLSGMAGMLAIRRRLV